MMGINALFVVTIAILGSLMLSGMIKIWLRTRSIPIAVCLGWMTVFVSFLLILGLYFDVAVPRFTRLNILEKVIVSMRFLYASAVIYPEIHTVAAMYLCELASKVYTESNDTNYMCESAKLKANTGLRLQGMIAA